MSKYLEIGSIIETSKILKISPDTVSDILHKKNIKILTSQEINKKKYSKKILCFNLENIFISEFEAFESAGDYAKNNLNASRANKWNN